MRQKISLGITLLILILLVSACDRVGRAPEDLDVTPTITPTATLTPSPTPSAAEETSTETSETGDLQGQLDVILAQVPDTVPAGAVQWRRDSAAGVQVPGNIVNGVGGKVFFTEQIGGKSNITYAIFDSAADAKTHFDKMFGIREPVAVGNPNANFPTPNMFGSGLYGSYALMQVQEIYFIEVYVEAFSSTSGNPLIPLAQQALNFLNAGITKFASPDTKPQQIEAIVAALPDEITAGETVWTRRVTRDPEILEEIPDGRGVKVLYQTEDADLFLTFAVFDTTEAMSAYYNSRQAARREGTLTYEVAGGSEDEDLPAPNLFASSQLVAAGALLQASETALVDIEMTSQGSAYDLKPVAEQAVLILETGLANFTAPQ